MINNQNTARLIRITIYIVMLVGLLIYGKISNPAVTLKMCFQNPEKYDGKTLFLGSAITIKTILHDGFEINQFDRVVKVKGAATGIAAGDYISLIAIFHREGWLELVDYHVAEKRRYKILVSLLPVALALFFFCRSFTINWKTLKIRERN